MGDYLQILIFVVIGILLIWIGYSIFFSKHSPLHHKLIFHRSKELTIDDIKGEPGNPQVCPVCSAKLIRGDQVRTRAFPSVSGGSDRLMYIRGCDICLNAKNKIPRNCPVCGAALGIDDYLVARMFERTLKKNHIHVAGCNYCKKMGNLAK